MDGNLKRLHLVLFTRVMHLIHKAHVQICKKKLQYDRQVKSDQSNCVQTLCHIVVVIYITIYCYGLIIVVKYNYNGNKQ